MDKTIGINGLIKLLKPIYEKKDYVIKDKDFPEVTVEYAMEELSDVLMRVTAEHHKEEKPLVEFHEPWFANRLWKTKAELWGTNK